MLFHSVFNFGHHTPPAVLSINLCKIYFSDLYVVNVVIDIQFLLYFLVYIINLSQNVRMYVFKILICFYTYIIVTIVVVVTIRKLYHLMREMMGKDIRSSTQNAI